MKTKTVKDVDYQTDMEIKNKEMEMSNYQEFTCDVCGQLVHTRDSRYTIHWPDMEALEWCPNSGRLVKSAEDGDSYGDVG